MKSKFTPSYLFFLITLGAYLLLSFSSNPPNGFTGAPGENTCQSCHNPQNSSFGGNVQILGLPATIMPNTSYSITIRVNATQGTPVRAGAQLVALNSSNQNAGTMVSTGPFTAFESSGGRTYVEHRPAQMFSGGVANFTFNWISPAGPGGDNITMYAAAVLGSNSNGSQNDRVVTSSITGQLQASGPPLVVNIVNSTNVSCFGGNNGSATASASGGTPPYNFNWSTGAVGATANNLPAGTHTVTVTDANSGSATAMVTITQPSQIQVNLVNQTNITCSTPQGSATVTAFGGTPGYTFNWSTGAIGATANNLNAGANFVTVTDTRSCSTVFTVTITQNITPPVANAGPPKSLDCTQSQVTLDGTNSSTGNNFNYLWTTTNGNIVSGATTLSPVVNQAGTYSLRVTNTSNGCVANASTSVIANTTPPLVDAGPAGSLDCANPIDTLNASITANSNNVQLNWTTTTGNILSGQNSLTPVVNASGWYILTATDLDNGCSGVDSVEVTVSNSMIMANAGPNQTLTCAVLEVVLDGGASSAGPNISYEWKDNSGIVLSNADTLLADTPGIFILTVTDDSNGCQAADTALVTLDNLAPLAHAGQDLNLTCQNRIDTLNGSGSSSGSGVGYTWTTNSGRITSGQNTLFPIVDTAGFYFLTVVDSSNGCSGNDTVVVFWFDDLQVNLFSAMDVSCFGAADGEIEVSISGGRAPFQLEWSNGDTSQLIQNLDGGSYTLVVTDADNCADTLQHTIFEPALLSSNGTSIGETSSGGNDGSASVNPTGGIPPYSVFWNTGDTSFTITNLSPGIYSAIVSDQNNCLALDTLVVNSFDCNLIVGVTAQPVSCFGGSDGALSLSIAGGTPPYEIEWSTGDTTLTLSNLPAGDYSVTVLDAANCQFILESQLPQAPPLVVFTEAIQAVSCFGGNDGIALASASGGTGTISSTWTNGSNQASIEMLTAGVYGVTATDDNGCMVTDSVTINQPADLVINFVIEHESSNGANDGSINAQISGGVPPYDLSWSNGDTTSQISGLVPGFYSLSVSDQNNCTKIDSAEVNSFLCDNFQVQIDAQNLYNCPGANAGSLSITDIQGGTPPYNIQWSTGDVGNTLENLGPGNYTIIVSDADDCEFSETFLVVEEDTIPPILIVQNLTIFLDANGAASIQPSDLDDGSSDNCELDSFLVDRQIFGCDDLGDNKVYVVVFDVHGNCSTDSAFVTVKDTLVPSISCPSTIQTSNCLSVDYPLPTFADNCGGATLSLISGLPPGSQFPDGQTTVGYMATDASGNESSCFFNVILDGLLVVGQSDIAYDCDTTAIVNFEVLGGTPPYSYQWSNGDTTSSTQISGQLQVRVTDANGCFLETAFNFIIPTPLTIILDSTNNETNMEENGAIYISVGGGTPAFVYQWSDESGNVIGSNQDINNLSAGNYTLVVTDQFGCQDSLLVTIDRLTGSLNPAERAWHCNLAPNPNNGSFDLLIDSKGPFEIEISILDLQGKIHFRRLEKIHSKGKVPITDLSLSPGVYFVKITNRLETSLIRMVVQD